MHAMLTVKCWIRRCAPVGLMLVVAGLLGCQTAALDEKPPQYLVAEGRAQIDPMKFADKVEWAQAFSGPLTSSAQTPVDVSIQDIGQRLLMAQAQARRVSLRQLSQHILTLPDASGRPLAKAIEKKPELTAAFNKLLEDQTKVSVEVKDLQAKAVASIDGKSVLGLFSKFDIPFQVRLSDLNAERQSTLKKDAYQQAMDDLRKQLQKKILEAKDHNGQPLRKRFDAHPERQRDMQAMLLLMMQPDSVRYEENGTCVMQTYFDVNKAYELADGGTSWWAFWR